MGRFHGTSGFMLMRAHRTVARWNPHHADDASTTRTRLDPRTVHEAGEGLMLAVVARCPRLGMMPMHGDDGAFSLLLFEPGAPRGSWAACDWEPGRTDYEVTQYGARRLWDEAEDAVAWWVRQGGPGPERYGLTVTEHGEYLWLDHPETTISPALRSVETNLRCLVRALRSQLGGDEMVAAGSAESEQAATDKRQGFPPAVAGSRSSTATTTSRRRCRRPGCGRCTRSPRVLSGANPSSSSGADRRCSALTRRLPSAPRRALYRAAAAPAR